MKISSRGVANGFLFLLTGLAMAGLQTSIWDQMFGAFSTPHFWLPVLVYWCLYRTTAEAIVFVYLISTVLSAFTIMPVGLLILINLGVAAVVSAGQQRLYVPGLNYFMLMCGLAGFLFTAFHLSLSWTLEEFPVTRVGVFLWIMRTLLTALAGGMLYGLFRALDRLTEKEIPAETGGGIE
jgi:hypothetical protein